MFSRDDLNLPFKEGISQLIRVGKDVLEKLSFCIDSGWCD